MLICRFGYMSVYGCAVEPSLPRHAAETVAVAALVSECVRDGVLPADAAISHRESGAPYIEGTVASVSVSHCREFALLAVHAGGLPIGIDAESANRGGQLERVAAKFLSEEQASLCGGDRALMLRAWTVKEAVYKCAGVAGLPLRSIPLPERLAGAAATIVKAGDVTIGHEYGAMPIQLYYINVPHFAGLVTLATGAAKPDAGY